MLDRADIGLLALVIVILCVAFLLNYWTLRRDKAVVQKYLLYQVRDDFVYLVAQGKLSEDGFLFQKFYGAVNNLIEETNTRLSLKSFLKALEGLQQKGLDPAEPDGLQRIAEELKKTNDADVARTVVSFFGAMFAIISENSLAVRSVRKWKGYTSKPKFLSRLFPLAKEAFSISRRYQQATNRFNIAA
jgi:hypothetical protein